MKYSEVLSRYVNTGSQIPEEQYDKLSSSLKKSYMRIRVVTGDDYSHWELKYINDNQRINYIRSKGVYLTSWNVNVLIKYSDNKDLIATKFIDVMGKNLSTLDIGYLVQYSEDKDFIATKIIDLKGKELDPQDVEYLLRYSEDKDLIATKIINAMSEELYYDAVERLLKYSEDKELITKLLLQNGVNYKKINKIINRLNIDIPLIPDDYQSMLNEIKRIKEIMK
jgi:hypothetical protein